jgi:hypothetical protein
VVSASGTTVPAAVTVPLTVPAVAFASGTGFHAPSWRWRVTVAGSPVWGSSSATVPFPAVANASAGPTTDVPAGGLGALAGPSAPSVSAASRAVPPSATSAASSGPPSATSAFPAFPLTSAFLSVNGPVATTPSPAPSVTLTFSASPPETGPTTSPSPALPAIALSRISTLAAPGT